MNSSGPMPPGPFPPGANSVPDTAAAHSPAPRAGGEPAVRRDAVGYFSAGWSLTAQGFLSVLTLVWLIVSIALVFVWVGLPMLVSALAAVRGLSMWQRRLAGGVLGWKVESPYRPVEADGVLEGLRIRLTDPATYRDALWLTVNATLGFALGIVTVVFYLVLPLGLMVGPVMVRTYLTFASFVLMRSDTEVMAQRIGELSSSRAETVHRT